MNNKKLKNIQLSGRFEGYESDIGSKYGGRVDYIAAREGAKVRKGQLIVKLDDSELQARLKAADANIEISQEQERQANIQLNVIQNQITQARLTLQQSSEDVSSTTGVAQASLSIAQTQYIQAQEQLRQSTAELQLATSDYNRYSNLVKNGSIPRNTYEQAVTRYQIAQSTQQIRLRDIETAKQQIERARSNLAQAESARYNPSIRSEQISLLQLQLLQAKSQLEAAKSNIQRSKAEKEEILAQIAHLNIKSPINGVIITRTIEPGEIVNAGRTLLTLLDYNAVYMRGYIPEEEIGLVKIGQKAKVYLDSAPKTPLDAYVSEIDSVASFTPENIYFREDRVKQVFGVKLNIINPQGYAKPGMPADAEIIPDNKDRSK